MTKTITKIFEYKVIQCIVLFILITISSIYAM